MPEGTEIKPIEEKKLDYTATFGLPGNRDKRQTRLYRDIVEKHLLDEEDEPKTARWQAIQIERILRNAFEEGKR